MRIFILVMIVVFLFANPSLASDTYYATYQGQISLVGSEPFIQVILSIGDRIAYTLSGPFVTELKHLSRFKVLLTGEVSPSRYPGTRGDIKVYIYSLLNPYGRAKGDWAVGYLRPSGTDLVVVGEDQVIYRVANPQVLEAFDYEHKKVLVVGVGEETGEYTATLRVETFKFLQ